MKVSRLEIKDVNQFKDLDIDLTYPKGHAKEGQPLDKVCFIGQSGTGKTSILKFIYALTYKLAPIDNEYVRSLFEKIYITKIVNNIVVRNSLAINNTVGSIQHKWTKQSIDNVPTKFDQVMPLYSSILAKIKTHLIYFPADMKYDNVGAAVTNENLSGPKIYDFSEYNINNIWDILLGEIQKQQEQELVLTQKISKIAIEENGDTKKLQDVVDELKRIRQSKSNPLVQLADNCLNAILRNFNLKVKTELDIRTKEDIGFIKIMDYHGNEIPNGLLSTGTKQIILSALPLYLLKPDKTIILYDEPERSLYPDMQKLIVDYYTSFTKDSQFFFATHSPIIASCFEPWEIVELKFDKEGYVVQEQYYEGERHVDNYTVNPKYLDYDQILQQVFDVDEPYNEERAKKITEFLSMKGKLDFLKKKNEVNTDEYKNTFKNYIKSGKELSWNVNTNKVA